MCYNVTMFMVNIADAKAKLSEYVEAAIRGERVLICNRNRPVAELRAIEQSTGQPRDLSPMYPGQTFMTDGFLEPMTEADVRQWYDNPAFPPSAQGRVAERPSSYVKAGAKTKKRRSK
jgi:prevent-host-death family protein